MRPLLTVFTWAGDDERIERHWPYWERSGCDILLSYPVDAPCARPGVAFHRSCHHGPELISRIFRTFEHVSGRQYATYYFIEADSVILGRVPVQLPPGFHGYFLPNDNEARFAAPLYPHYAHGMGRATLMDVIQGMALSEVDMEEGYPDRFLGRVLFENYIPMTNRVDLMYSRNLLDQPKYIAGARDAIAHGALFIHGIKEQHHLDAILK